MSSTETEENRLREQLDLERDSRIEAHLKLRIG